MFGVGEIIDWFDYDLSSAYTTAMSFLSLPDYAKAVLISEDEFNKKSWDELLKGFYIINGSFSFEDH